MQQQGQQGQQSVQVFYWIGEGLPRDGRVHYTHFCLNNQHYTIGDCVYLFPEDDSCPHYVGRVLSAFVDLPSGQADPHCIEVKWFERRTNLEQNTKGIEESEREVFELGDTDINPIGCISGKCCILKARNYEEAYQAMSGVTDTDWFFCRGYFLQETNSFQPYTAAELADNAGLPPGVRLSGLVPPIDGGALEGAVALAQAQAMHSAGGSAGEEQEVAGAKRAPRGGGAAAARAQQPQAKRKATGRVCAECGATSTPQWREGPTGPKTLCNACGVRYVRAQQRGNKRGGGSGRGAARGGAASAAGRSPAAGKAKASRGEAEERLAPSLARAAATQAAAASGHRPIRQAALAAATRTAAFARGGEFGEEEEGGGQGEEEEEEELLEEDEEALAARNAGSKRRMAGARRDLAPGSADEEARQHVPSHGLGALEPGSSARAAHAAHAEPAGNGDVMLAEAVYKHLVEEGSKGAAAPASADEQAAG